MKNKEERTPESELFYELFSNTKGSVIKKETVTFDELFYVKYPPNYGSNFTLLSTWGRFEVYAELTRDQEMHKWQGHNKSPEFIKHIAKKGTTVRVWMISRMGDVGVTDNLVNPTGYDSRGLDVEKDLINWKFVRISNNLK